MTLKQFRRTNLIVGAFVGIILTIGIVVSGQLLLLPIAWGMLALQQFAIFNDTLLKILVKPSPYYEEWFGDRRDNETSA